MENHAIVPRADWLLARKNLLAKEKELTRLRDHVAHLRRDLPWVRVTKNYMFAGQNGFASLNDLFGGKDQLIVYHFMFGAEWREGCPICSFWADSFTSIAVHLANRNVTLAAVSSAPFPTLLAYKKRMGWTFPWYSTNAEEFSTDFHVFHTQEQVDLGEACYNFEQTRVYGERPGVSVFFRDPTDAIFHTYSAYARGLDALNSCYQFLDLTPTGRDELELPWPMAWVRRRDQYVAPTNRQIAT